MVRAMMYVAAYDISSNQERRRVERTLRNFGFRAQRSVFECLLDASGLRHLTRLLKELDPQTGFVRLYRLPGGHSSVDIGHSPTPSPDDGPAFIV